MKNLFLNYELSLIAKEKGFDCLCLAYYNNHIEGLEKLKGLVLGKTFQDHNGETEGDNLICSAPVHQQITNWFIEKHDIWVNVDWTGRPEILDLKPRKNSYKGKSLFEICIDGKYGGFEYYFALNKAIQETFKLI